MCGKEKNENQNVFPLVIGILNFCGGLLVLPCSPMGAIFSAGVFAPNHVFRQ
jgi:hypothetical protein